MVLMIPEEGSFSLSAYITTPGYQTVIPKGYLKSTRNGEVWIAPLIPQLFYGVTGQQLGPSWRQYFSGTGEHVILSRVAGQPEVPREELYWKKISEEKVPELEAAAEVTEGWDWVHYAMFALGFLPLIFTAGVVVANEIQRGR